MKSSQFLGVWTALLAGLFAVAPSLAEAPFQNMSYDKARAAAKKAGKIVVIDFYTTWCGPCKHLDQTTWKDKDVQSWLAKNAIALKIDAEKESALSKKFRVRSYPTIILIKADGEEMDRLIGYRGAKRFLSEAKDALAGKDSLSRAREKLKGRENDPSARSYYADVLKHKGLYKEALDEYLWCFDHGNKHQPSYDVVRLSFLLGDIVGLGRVSPGLEGDSGKT